MGCMDNTAATFDAIVAEWHNAQEGSSMRYALPDGKVVTGRSYTDIIAAMADEKLIGPRSLTTYKRTLAKRVKAFYDKTIDTSDDQKFVDSLVDAGMLVKIK